MMFTKKTPPRLYFVVRYTDRFPIKLIDASFSKDSFASQTQWSFHFIQWIFYKNKTLLIKSEDNRERNEPIMYLIALHPPLCFMSGAGFVDSWWTCGERVVEDSMSILLSLIWDEIKKNILMVFIDMLHRISKRGRSHTVCVLLSSWLLANRDCLPSLL